MQSSRVAAVVVTYNPDQNFVERLDCTAQQVDEIIIVDNNSSQDDLGMIKKTATSVRAHLVVNDSNLGIAVALNQGIRFAISEGCDWVLLLDQDSRPEPGMVKELIAAYQSFAHHDRAAIVAPIVVDEHLSHHEPKLYKDCEGRQSTEVKMVQTSGSLIPVSVFAEVGFLREDFFLDNVDFEYCFRLREKGYSVILACKARLLHNLGDSCFRRFLWKADMRVTHYDYVRRYYITRNRLITLRDYALNEPRWAIGEVLAFGKDFLKILFFEENRKAKVRSILMGARDAAFSKTGKLPHSGR